MAVQNPAALRPVPASGLATFLELLAEIAQQIPEEAWEERAREMRPLPEKETNAPGVKRAA